MGMKIDVLRCPLCGDKLQKLNNSIICSNRHTFNISRKNSVNFVNTNRKTPYNSVFFHHRQSVLSNGYFDGVLDNILPYIDVGDIIADLGSGEGYFSKKIRKLYPNKTVYGLDYSKYAINQAIKGEKSGVHWLVGDISNLPFRNNSLDIILNIFSPANYQEFARVLKKDGIIVKVVPKKEHFKQLRDSLFEEQFMIPDGFQLIDQIEYKENFNVSVDLVESINKMTPVRFGKNHLIEVDEITVHCLVVVMCYNL